MPTALQAQQSDSTEYRDPYKWPFTKTSIWNMPIGSGARYIPAGIERSTARGMTIDEDVIVTMPGEDLMAIYENNAAWDRTKSRCEVEGKFILAAPIPADFIVSPSTWDGLTPNSGLAVVAPDGKTIFQTQPFAHCSPGLVGTSRYSFGSTSVYGSGYYGAHGGSKLSAIGGTLRHWELSPDAGPIRHALKINLCAAKNLYYDAETKGYRWPATAADGAAPTTYGKDRATPPVKECLMGALLALPPTIDLDSLGFETEPARILAEAFRDYGAYVVDNTGWDVYALVTEWSPQGRVADQFKKDWGFDIRQKSKNTPWGRDMDRIFLNLHIVDNNSVDSIGGGGEPRMPLAPDFLPTVNISIEADSTMPKVRYTRPAYFKASTGTKTLVKITEIPPGYVFRNWSVTEGDAVIDLPNELKTTIQVKNQNSSIKANFEIEYYSLSTSKTGNGNIYISPLQDNYTYGTALTLTANPDSGWQFSSWGGDITSTENPLSLNVQGETIISAVFETIVGVDNERNEPGKNISVGYDPSTFQIYINTERNTEKYIFVCNILGEKIKSTGMTFSREVQVSLDGLKTGIYFVTIFEKGQCLVTKKFVKQ